jgi:hypothetical protein
MIITFVKYSVSCKYEFMNVSAYRSLNLKFLGLYTLIRALREDWNTFSSEKTTLDQKASSFNISIPAQNLFLLPCVVGLTPVYSPQHDYEAR